MPAAATRLNHDRDRQRRSCIERLLFQRRNPIQAIFEVRIDDDQRPGKNWVGAGLDAVVGAWIAFDQPFPNGLLIRGGTLPPLEQYRMFTGVTRRTAATGARKRASDIPRDSVHRYHRTDRARTEQRKMKEFFPIDIQTRHD